MLYSSLSLRLIYREEYTRIIFLPINQVIVVSMIIGRMSEKQILNSIYTSKEAELVAVYGRRRVGKTYLIKNYFQAENCVYFHITGIKKGALPIQLDRYTKVFSDVFYPGVSIKSPRTWIGAFEVLTEAIDKIQKTKKVVLFFDELPWLAHRKSGVLQALEYFWNRYWVDNPRLKLILCGSSSSWMIDKIIKNRGGLHNRLTRKIKLMPFTLQEAKLFLDSQGVNLSQKQVLKIYMVLGGIPYYLKQILKNKSIDQNINQLLFHSDALFFDEFDEVFSSLFEESDSYKELVKIIAKSNNGLLRSDLEKQSKLTGKGGYLSKRLDDLEASGFVSSYIPFKHKKRGTYYKLSDEYCRFYLKWINPIKAQLKQENNVQYWFSIVNTPAYYAWAGYAFENVCYKHIGQIKKALSIPIAALGSPWQYIAAKNSSLSGAQIDLLFDRTDEAISLCEIKYTEKPFLIDKAYANELMSKIDVFKKITGTIKRQLSLPVGDN